VTGDARRQFVAALVPIAAEFLTAKDEMNIDAMNVALVKLLNMPAEMLRLGSEDNAPKPRLLVEDAADESEKKYEAVGAEDGDRDEEPVIDDGDDPEFEDPDRQSDKNARCANYFCSIGKVKKGVDALLRRPIVTMSGEVIDKLCQLVVKPAAGRPRPVLPDGVLLVDITDAELLTNLKKCTNGSSPDLDRLTGELLMVMREHDTTKEALKQILMMIINNDERISKDTRTRLKASELIALGKKLGGVRPITLGSVVMKLAERIQHNKLSRDELDPIFKDVQFGAGPRAPGADQAVNILQSVVEIAAQGDEEQICIKLDFKNAFGTISRSDIFNMLNKHHAVFGRLFNLVKFCYDDPGTLTLYQQNLLVARLYSMEGVNQGSVLGPLLFALALQGVLDEVQAKFPEVKLVAVLDDVHLVGKTETAFLAYVDLGARAGACNLELSKPKTQVMVCRAESGVASDRLKQLCTEHGLNDPTNFMLTLGTCIGLNDAAKIECIEQKIDGLIDVWFKAVNHKLIRPQYKYWMIKECGHTQLGYLARTCRPDLAAAAMERFDNKVIAAFGEATGIGYDELTAHTKTRVQVQQPVRMGGFALRPYTNINPIAYYSSQAAAVKHMQHIAPCDTHAETATEKELTRVHNVLVQLGVSPRTLDQNQHQIFPSDDTREERSAFYTEKTVPHLQHALQIQVDARAERNVKRHLGPNDPARLRALTQKGARRTLAKHSFTPKFCLCNAEFCLLVRMRLGLMPCAPDQLPQVCVCGADLKDLPNNHLLTCQRAAESGWIVSHNGLCAALAAVAKSAACVVRREVTYPGFDVRPDLVIVDPTGKTILVDVSALQSDAQSYALRAAGAAVEQRERDKEKKYLALSEHTKAEFVGFAVDRFGGFGVKAQELLQRLALFSDQFSTHVSGDDPAPLFVIWAAMMKALYQGNVALVRQAVQKCEYARTERMFFAPHHGAGHAVGPVAG
jgi:hypothetical protein